MRGRFANWDRWLTEEERPGFSEVEAIADFTHVPVGYLFLSEPPQEELPIPDFRAGRGPDVAPSGDLLETIYLNRRRQGWYEDYLTEFGDEGYSRDVWECFPSAIGRWPAPAGYHGYKTNTPMNPEGTGHHHGLYHGIDR